MPERLLMSPEMSPEPSPEMAPEMDEALDRIYGAPPDQFTAERDALVKQLKGADKQAAAAVRALRRPPVTAWALNQVARRQAGELSELFEADDALSRSQREGKGREALAEAGRARREIITRLVTAALRILAESGHPDSAANRDRIAQSLAAVAVDTEGREALARGRLTRDLTPGSLWETGGPGGGPASGDDPEGAADDVAATERRRELQRKAEDLSAEAKRLGAEASRLDADAAKAEAVARIARSVANEARRKAEGAAAKAEAAARDE